MLALRAGRDLTVADAKGRKVGRLSLLAIDAAGRRLRPTELATAADVLGLAGTGPDAASARTPTGP